MLCFIKKILWLFGKFILPYHCILCLEISDQNRDICRQCQNELPVLSHTCPQCSSALSITHPVARCGQCIKHPPYFERTLVGFNYQSPVDTWLKQFKFYKKGLYARILTEIYAEKLVAHLELHPEDRPQVLVPMPLHWRRISYRGFNQSTIIARYLSKKLHIPLLKPAYVRRIKHTLPQASLRRQARYTNMNGVFLVQKLHNINHVGIVDDIFTTGNTVNELAKQLKIQGLQRISVWVLAKVNR